MIVILENVRSSFNVGAIFRTADAVGAEKIYLCGITPAPADKFGRVNSEIAKVALGSEKYLNWEKIGSVLSLAKKLRGAGYKILAVEQDKRAVPYSQFKIQYSKFALVVGNETVGLSKPVLKFVDKILEIPMRGRKESLNVAVAFGIVAYGLTEFVK